MDSNTNKVSYYVTFNYYLHGEYYFENRVIPSDRLDTPYTDMWTVAMKEYLEQWYRSPVIMNIIELKNE